MITYKVSKGYYNGDWNRHRCQSRHGCWDMKIKTVKVTTTLNCKCCKGGHKETYYMCDEHLKDLPRFLPRSTGIELRWDDIDDPVSNLFKL